MKERKQKELQSRAIYHNTDDNLCYDSDLSDITGGKNRTIKKYEQKGSIDKNIIHDIVDDVVKNPSHYTWIKGIECKDVVSHFDFNKGCAIKYIWRSGKKDNEIQDLKKAIECLNNEIKYIEGKK
jgi:hypothetical protein